MNLLQKTPLQIRQEQIAKHFNQYKLKQNLSNFQSNLKNNLLYGHKNNLLNCGLMLGNMNTGAYRGGAGWDWESDLSSDEGWVSSDGTAMAYNGTTDKLDLLFKGDGSNDCIVIDSQIAAILNGTPISDTAWVYRFKYGLTAFVTGSGMHDHIGISASDQTAGQSTAQDFLGVNNDAGDVYIVSLDADGAVIPTGGSGDDAQSMTYVAATDYWNEIVRLSATAYRNRIYSDAFTTLVQTSTGATPSTVASLRYFKMCNRVTSAAGTTTVAFDDPQFANGVTVAP